MNKDFLIKGKQIMIEMLQDRKYTNIKESEEDNIIKSDQVIVSFSDEIKLNINHIREFIKLIDNNEYKHGILVYPQTITPAAKNFLKTVKDFNIELFELIELQYNRTKHRLVPKHIKITGEEEQLIRQKYIKNIAYMLETDPISQYYAFKKGDIIKIIRNNGSIFYRIVI